MPKSRSRGGTELPSTTTRKTRCSNIARKKGGDASRPSPAPNAMNNAGSSDSSSVSMRSRFPASSVEMRVPEKTKAASNDAAFGKPIPRDDVTRLAARRAERRTGVRPPRSHRLRDLERVENLRLSHDADRRGFVARTLVGYASLQGRIHTILHPDQIRGLWRE